MAKRYKRSRARASTGHTSVMAQAHPPDAGGTSEPDFFGSHRN